MSDLDLGPEIAAFIRDRARLKNEGKREWIVYAGTHFQADFDDYEKAARFAIEKFHDTSFLVRGLDEEDERVPLVFAAAE